MRKIEQNGFPPTIAPTGVLTINSHLDKQTIIAFRFNSGAFSMIVEGGDNPPAISFTYAVPAGQVQVLVFSTAYFGAVVGGARQTFPALPYITLQPVGTTWANTTLNVIHVIDD